MEHHLSIKKKKRKKGKGEKSLTGRVSLLTVNQEQDALVTCSALLGRDGHWH